MTDNLILSLQIVILLQMAVINWRLHREGKEMRRTSEEAQRIVALIEESRALIKGFRTEIADLTRRIEMIERQRAGRLR